MLRGSIFKCTAIYRLVIVIFREELIFILEKTRSFCKYMYIHSMKTYNISRYLEGMWLGGERRY